MVMKRRMDEGEKKKKMGRGEDPFQLFSEPVPGRQSQPNISPTGYLPRLPYVPSSPQPKVDHIKKNTPERQSRTRCLVLWLGVAILELCAPDALVSA